MAVNTCRLTILIPFWHHADRMSQIRNRSSLCRGINEWGAHRKAVSIWNLWALTFLLAQNLTRWKVDSLCGQGV